MTEKDSITFDELIGIIEKKLKHDLDYYDQAIPKAGVSFGALEMQCERHAIRTTLMELIVHLRGLRMRRDKADDYEWEGK